MTLRERAKLISRSHPLIDLQRQIARLGAAGEEARTLEIPALTYGEYVASLAQLPGVRGCWGMGSVDNTGAVYDASGQGRTLTYNGNPTFNIFGDSVPYCDYDGTGDYHARASENGLQVSGAETIYASAVRGLTMAVWLYSTVAGTNQGLASKWNATGNQRSYRIIKTSGNLADFSVSSNGTAVTTVTSTGTLTTGTPHCIVARYTPSTELAIWLDGVKDTNTTAIPASIFNTSTAAFELARYDAGTLLTGRIFAAVLAANAWPDDLCQALWLGGRHLLGV